MDTHIPIPTMAKVPNTIEAPTNSAAMDDDVGTPNDGDDDVFYTQDASAPTVQHDTTDYDGE
jgi:hypothetical protein